ncbi:MAG TPA: hypothetical protein VHQ01_05065 [Pyrinomonadaceae bacterium]|nr:hypothetical protein [Pyrinomonadaceae bacterium]
MDPNTITPQQALVLGILINAGVGLVVGLIPLVLGLVKRNVKYGFYGLLASIVGGAILGIILSIPAAVIFSWLIVRGAKPVAATAGGS